MTKVIKPVNLVQAMLITWLIKLVALSMTYLIILYLIINQLLSKHDWSKTPKDFISCTIEIFHLVIIQSF